jgi:hypothetical protein
MHWSLAILIAGPAFVRGQDPCRLDALLPRISAAAIELRDALSSAVAWEDYVQEILEVDDPSAPFMKKLAESTLVDRRRLGSDVLFARMPSGEYYGFRDVAHVDRREVAQRGDRIRRLFVALRGDASQAQEIIEESARYNLGDVQRNLNIPTLILHLLLPDQMGRIDFLPAEGGYRGDGPCVVSFREVREPYLVGTHDGRGRPLRGTLTVAPESGRIERVEFNVAHFAGERVDLSVDFGVFPGWNLLLPSRMTELYAQKPGFIRCEARYSNYRRFSVEATEELRIPK